MSGSGSVSGSVPRRLKPHVFHVVYGTAEAVPLSKTSQTDPLQKPGVRMSAMPGFVFGLSAASYLTTDWKRGDVRRLANWLSDDE
jgi:hypothetical protein